MRKIAILAVMAVFAAINPLSSEEPYVPTFFPLENSSERIAPMQFPETSLWKVEYDDTLDGELKPIKNHLLVVKAANNRLSAHYQNEQADGKENDSLFTGELIPGSPSIVTFRQDDQPDYTAIYTGHLVAEGRFVGTYQDNHRFSGDWSMTLVTEQIIEPLASELPNDEMFESVLGVYGKAIRGNRSPFVNLRPPHRNLWTEEIKEFIQPTLSYESVDYIGTAKLFLPETGTYTVSLPDTGVQFRVNDHLLEAGDVDLKRGLYQIEIYTNHWGQPYLTYAEATVFKKGTKEAIPFVNSAADIEAFRSEIIEGKSVVEVCKYVPQQIEL